MFLMSSKATPLVFEVVDNFVVADDSKVFMGKFDLSEIKALSRTLRNFVATQPRPAIPNLDEFSDRDLAEAYIALRTRKADSNRAADVVEAGYKEAMEKIAIVFLVRLNERGSKSTAVEGVGSVTRITKMQPSSGDWKLTYNFLLDEAIRLREEGKDATEVFSFLQKRLLAKPINDYAKTHEGEVPPGVNVLKTYTVRVQKAGDKGGDDEGGYDE